MRPERRADRPGRDLGAGHLRDDPFILLEGGGAERRHQKLAGAFVLKPVQEKHGVGAHHRAEDRVRLARVEDRGVPGEDLSGGVGAGEDRKGVAGGCDPQGERAPESSRHPRDEGVPKPEQGNGLRDGWPPESGWEDCFPQLNFRRFAKGAHLFETGLGPLPNLLLHAHRVIVPPASGWMPPNDGPGMPRRARW